MKTFSITLFLLIIFSPLSFSDSTCIRVSGEGDEVYERPELANQIESEHFIIHWESPTTQNYAQNTSDYAEYAYEKQCGVGEMNWRVPPADDDRGGDSRYDIYLVSPEIIGNFKGITQAEIIGNWINEWAPSFILIVDTVAASFPVIII